MIIYYGNLHNGKFQYFGGFQCYSESKHLGELEDNTGYQPGPHIPVRRP